MAESFRLPIYRQSSFPGVAHTSSFLRALFLFVVIFGCKVPRLAGMSFCRCSFLARIAPYVVFGLYVWLRWAFFSWEFFTGARLGDRGRSMLFGGYGRYPFHGGGTLFISISALLKVLFTSTRIVLSIVSRCVFFVRISLLSSLQWY